MGGVSHNVGGREIRNTWRGHGERDITKHHQANRTGEQPTVVVKVAIVRLYTERGSRFLEVRRATTQWEGLHHTLRVAGQCSSMQKRCHDVRKSILYVIRISVVIELRISTLIWQYNLHGSLTLLGNKP